MSWWMKNVLFSCKIEKTYIFMFLLQGKVVSNRLVPGTENIFKTELFGQTQNQQNPVNII